MLAYTPEAEAQVDALREHYQSLGRIEALRNLAAALHRAERRVAANREVGQPAPRPYPGLAEPGRCWIKEGRYWVAYRLTPPVIVGVFYDTADLPGRAGIAQGAADA